MLPLIKAKPFYPAQWGIPGADTPLGLRTLPGAMVYYVQSTHTNASNSNDGTDPDYPLATIAQAVTNATAGRGDIVMVGPGHVETWASAAASATLSKSGLTVLGVGSGQLRPRINYTHTASILTVSAANVTVENLLFQVGVDSIVIMVDVNADDFTLRNCEFRENTAVAQQWLTCVDINGGGANAADRCKILGCTFISEAAGANQAIEIGAVEDGIVIEGNWITGDYAVAGIHSGSALTNLLLKDNIIRNVNAADFAVELTAAATGMAIDNRFYADALATTFDPGSLMCAGNLAVDAIDQSAVPIPATAAQPLPDGSIGAATFAAGAIDATAIANGAIDAATFAAGAIAQAAIAADTILGANNADNVFDSSTVTGNRDGSLIERLEYMQTAMPRCVAKLDGEVINAAGVGDAIFTITGGPVRAKITGLVTTLIGGAANMSLQITTTAPAATVTLNAAPVAINDDAVGTIYRNVGATSVFTPSTALGLVLSDPVTVEEVDLILTPGTVYALASAPQAGVIAWYMTFWPLAPTSMVVAAA